VASESVGQDILISGRVDMNRAFDGDAVAVELLPEDQWRSPAGLLFLRDTSPILYDSDFDGDAVAVELLAEDQRRAPAYLLLFVQNRGYYRGFHSISAAFACGRTTQQKAWGRCFTPWQTPVDRVSKPYASCRAERLPAKGKAGADAAKGDGSEDEGEEGGHIAEVTIMRDRCL